MTVQETVDKRRALAMAALCCVPRPMLRRALFAIPTSAQRHPRNAVGDLASQLDQGLNFYVIDIFRRGANFAVFQNPLVKQIWEMLVVLLIPMIIRYVLLGDWSEWREKLSGMFAGIAWRQPFIRIIEYTEGGSTRMRFNPFLDDQQSMVESTDRNNLLQKAIRLYMSEKYKLNAAEMEANLTPAKKVQIEMKEDQYGRRSTFSGSYSQLMSFVVQLMPKKGKWMLVDREKQIYFMQLVQETPQGDQNNTSIQTKTLFHIKCSGPDAARSVNDWINAAFAYYKEQKKSEQDTSRFFYIAVPPEGGKDDKKPKYFFKQYLLSDHKTFNSLFFPDKEPLLKLIDQFTKKEGKFAIEGFPNKLGLLLDGPPGTGKTSLIKALAHYLNRHVVSVNLSRIKTNQELMDLLFDLIFPVQGGDLPVKLKYHDIIFVMEDVDAASKVVYARAGSKKTPKKGKKKSAKDAPQSPEISKEKDATTISADVTSKVDESSTSPENQKVAEASSTAACSGEAKDGATASAANSKDSDALPTSKEGSAEPVGKSPPPQMPTLLRSISTSESVKGAQDTAQVENKKEDEVADSDDGEDEEEEEKSPKRSESKKAETIVGEMLCKMIGGGDSSGDEKDGKSKKTSSFIGPWKSSLYDGDDDLNLAGLLNVLDGVVDSPGRVVVMTTNHPEKLDAALIRPGRINKRIHLGYVSGASLCQMVAHYMQVTPSEDEKLTFLSIAEQIAIAPAQVEQCCAESESLAELSQKLKDLR